MTRVSYCPHFAEGETGTEKGWSCPGSNSWHWTKPRCRVGRSERRVHDELRTVTSTEQKSEVAAGEDRARVAWRVCVCVHISVCVHCVSPCVLVHVQM